ncbi:hypothetical protein DRM94_19480 [Aeromonas taiwanensis]|uniref:Uncharacterized protein n=1 Tax=Aeromonas taiwanensis TaxID=633417 RepID=A0A5F0K620_9GAMM|nr:hypothetical protein DRM93_19480 [Aeromonas taiwanensis]TFF72141.1 hypothetical protein DRM95_19635 [Aeromonas taiwanensis]TFF74683.1 hypothetical protein DRM94_19480 [Aeromonas taiwanensis]
MLISLLHIQLPLSVNPPFVSSTMLGGSLWIHASDQEDRSADMASTNGFQGERIGMERRNLVN